MSQPPSSRTQSRAASVASEREYEGPPTQSPRNRRGRSRTPRSLSASSEASEPEPTSATGKRKDRHGGKKQSGLPAVGEVEDTSRSLQSTTKGTVGNVNNTVGQAQGGKDEEDKKDPMRLRLDLNLEVEIEIKAKIHGDLTLALL